MQYRIVFAAEKVGQADMPPFEIVVPDAYGVESRTLELSRQIRSRIVNALTYAPAPGATDARPVIEEHTQVVVQLRAGEGAAYYGTTTLGRFNLYAID